MEKQTLIDLIKDKKMLTVDRLLHDNRRSIRSYNVVYDDYMEEYQFKHDDDNNQLDLQFDYLLEIINHKPCDIKLSFPE